MKPITQVLLNRRSDILNEYYMVDAQIQKRISYIITYIFDTCGYIVHDWQLFNEGEDICNIIKTNSLDTSGINFNLEKLREDADPFLIINNKLVCIYRRLPKRWLFESFEKEIINANSPFNRQLIQQIKNKFTTAEKIMYESWEENIEMQEEI